MFNIVIMGKHKTDVISCTIDLTSVKYFSKVFNPTTFSFFKKCSIFQVTSKIVLKICEQDFKDFTDNII